MKRLDQNGDHALFEGRLHGIIAVCYENERPLLGLAGLLDWRFQGAISNCLRAGAITGKSGECAYVPVTRTGKTYHILLIGGGRCPRYGERDTPPAESIKALHKNLSSLRLDGIGLSRSDFGGITDEQIKKHMKDTPLWVVT